MLLTALATPGTLLAQAIATQNPSPPEVQAAAGEPAPAAGEGGAFRYFTFLTEYDRGEQLALWITLGVAVAGLAYAGALVGQVLGADQGTERMRTVARAIKEGANAYLYRQFKAIVLLVFLITAILYFTASAETGRRSAGGGRRPSSWGRPSPGWSASAA
jgi:K(+)-stimulated pyrophosphate-energized sodium pump